MLTSAKERNDGDANTEVATKRGELNGRHDRERRH